MDSGILDVLHDPADDHSLAVRDRVDIALKRILEEAIDQDRSFLGDSRRGREVFLERVCVVDDLHRAATEHVRRAHEHRIADSLRRLQCFREARCRAVRRLVQPEIAGDVLETPAVLGDVDRVGRRTENLDTGASA